MKLSSRIVVWFQALVVIGCFSVLQAETKSKAGTYVASSVKGTVTWVDPVTKAEAPLTKGTRLPEGAIVNTGEASTATLVFANGATTTLAPETSLEVSQFKQQAFAAEALLDDSIEPSVSVTKLSIIRGELTGEVRKLRTGSEFTINSPVGAAGVRGTTFRVTYTPGNSIMRIQVANGLVVFVDLSDGTETPITDTQSMTVNGLSGPRNVSFLTPDEAADIVRVAEAARQEINEALDAREAAGETNQGAIKGEIIIVPETDEISASGF